jgi:surface polysaccharide O-acyltransferase-like enzyme
MVFLYWIALIVIALFGEIGTLVDSVNGLFGSSLPGVVWFFIGWIVFAILRSLVRKVNQV